MDMTYKGKEITEEEITIDFIKEIVKSYLPNLYRYKSYGFPYLKAYNNDDNILSPKLILDDFTQYLHRKSRKKKIDDVECCIRERIKEKKYWFRSRDYISFIESIKQKRRDTLNHRIEERIENAPEGHQAYNDQLKDPRWSAFRNFVLVVRKMRCEKCGSKEALQVHHPQYITGRKAWEYTCNEVQVLCRECHKKIHGIKEAS